MAKKFISSQTRRYLKLGKKKKSLRKWRKAKGIHSKIKIKKKGKPFPPSPGYKTPRRNPPILINNLSDLKKLKDKNAIAILSGNLGARKKLDILKKANESKIKILNIKYGGKK